MYEDAKGVGEGRGYMMVNLVYREIKKKKEEGGGSEIRDKRR